MIVRTALKKVVPVQDEPCTSTGKTTSQQDVISKDAAQPNAAAAQQALPATSTLASSDGALMKGSRS